MIGIKNSNGNMQDTADFNGVLESDQISHILNNFSTSLDILEEDLKYAVKARDSSNLLIDEQIKLDTYLAYANSTLFWMFLKLQGCDLSKVTMFTVIMFTFKNQYISSQHYILHDLGRAKEMLAREKEITDAKTAPRLDIAASKRFIARGIHARFVEMNGVMVTEEQYKRSLLENESKK